MMAMRPKSSLPPGFRFHPTDIELVCYYLRRKVMGKPFRFQAIPEIELYKYAPWDLPALSLLRSNDLEWYFFCPRDKKYPNGSRANRATDIGYWKATGKDRLVTHNLRTIGMKKTLIFHVGKPPKGKRTDWVMYEYRLDDKELASAGFSQEAYVLCKIFQKSGLGPKIGEEYGAPFNEEEWEDDITDNSFSLPFPSFSISGPMMNEHMPVNPICEQPENDIAEACPDLDINIDDGISLDDLTRFLHSSPILENSSFEMANPATLYSNTVEASTVESEQVFNELEDLPVQVASSADIHYPDTLLDENDLYSVLSDFYDNEYVELKDFDYLDGSIKDYPLLSPHQVTMQSTSQELGDIYDPSYLNNDLTSTEMHSSTQTDLQ